MEGEDENSDDPRSFHNKPAWKKFIILVAGAFMNFVAGLLLILILFSVAGSPSMPVVGEFLSGGYDRSKLYDPGFSHGFRGASQ